MKTIERFKDLKIGRRRSRCEPKAWQSQREIPRFTRNGVCNLLIVIALCSLFPSLLYSQVDTAWVRRYNGPGNGSDGANAIAVDGQSNVYVTGRSVGSGTYCDYTTIKYNSAGVQEWVARYNGPGNSYDYAYSLAVDGQGNVYVTGSSYGSGTDYDYATIKYNSAGVQEWVARYNGPGNFYDEAYSIAVDGQGNVYVTGASYGSDTYGDYATIKYNSVGVEQWIARYNGPGNDDDEPYSLAVDGSGNGYVTGYSYGSGASQDYATIKYNSSGVQQWVARYNGPGNGDDWANSLAVDGSGNVYVTGYTEYSPFDCDYATIKYNSAGVQQWVQRYNGPAYNVDGAYSLAVDGQGNVYVTGGSVGSGTYDDYATIKYNSAGVQEWVARYNGPGNGGDEALAIAVDGSGNVYVTGYSGIYPNYDYATIKYNSAGIQQWVARYNGPGNGEDRAYSLAVDGQSNVYVTGYSVGSGTSGDYATIKYVQTPGIEEIGVAKGNCAMTKSVEVYPNPAKSCFTIRFPQTLKQVQGDNCLLKIFDVSGKVVKEVRVKTQEERISLDGIKNGVYFVQVTTPLSLRAEGVAIPETIIQKLVVTK